MSYIYKQKIANWDYYEIQKTSSTNDDLLKFKKYTLTYIDVMDEHSTKRLTRETIYDLYKDELDTFAEQLEVD